MIFPQLQSPHNCCWICSKLFGEKTMAVSFLLLFSTVDRFFIFASIYFENNSIAFRIKFFVRFAWRFQTDLKRFVIGVCRFIADSSASCCSGSQHLQNFTAILGDIVFTCKQMSTMSMLIQALTELTNPRLKYAFLTKAIHSAPFEGCTMHCINRMWK